MEAKNPKNLKKCVSLMKRHNYVRVYINLTTGICFPVEYADSNSYTVFEDKNVFEVFTFNRTQQHVPTMSELKESIEEKLVDILRGEFYELIG